MITRKCDLCSLGIDEENDNEFVSFGIRDLCGKCVSTVRRAICQKCHGTGKFREADREASDRGASCGENRTEYRTVTCHECIGSK